MANKNRYLTIKPSNVNKDEFGDYYPDIFTFPINKFEVSEVPAKYALTQNDIYRFDLFIAAYYGTSDYDDIILWLNNIDHIADVPVGTTILLPSKNDLDSFYEEFYV